MFQSKEAIYQNIITIFSDTDVTSNEIKQVLEENNYNYNLSIEKLSRIAASKSFPTDDMKLSSNLSVERGSDISYYETYSSITNFSRTKEKSTKSSKRYALSLVHMKYPGIVQFLLREFASLIPGKNFEFSLTIGSKSSFSNDSEQDLIRDFIISFVEEMCGSVKVQSFEEKRGILVLNVDGFNPPFRDPPK